MNVLGALYATTLFFSIINATVIQPVISAERAVSYRERAAGMYSILPWTLALVSALCPMSLNVSIHAVVAQQSDGMESCTQVLRESGFSWCGCQWQAASLFDPLDD